MKKVAVIRGLMPRLAHAELVANFRKLHASLIAEKLNPEIERYLKKRKISYNSLNLKPVFGFDPIKLIYGKTHHRSWVNLDSLENILENFAVFETYEVFHFFSAQAAKIAGKQNKKLVTEIWTSFDHPARKIFPYSSNVKEVINKTDKLVLRSKKALSYLKPFKISNKKVEVIYPGVDLKRFEQGKKTEKIVILFVGELERYKGIDDLLLVFKRLREKNRKIELWVCGKGSFEQEIRQEAKKPFVKFFGNVENSKLGEIYSKADIFCSPSKDIYYFGVKFWEEYFSYTLLEAQASGLPIVANKSGGVEEEIGKNNLLVNQKDLLGLEKALTKLIESKSLRESLGEENRQRAKEKFDIVKQTFLLEELITQIL